MQTLAEHKRMIEQMREGTLSAETLKANYRAWLANKETIIAEINKMTVKDIKDIVKQFARIDGKKSDLVGRYWDHLCGMFAVATPLKFPLQGFSREQLMDGTYERVKAANQLAAVDATTDENLAEMAAGHQARKAERDQAMEDPQTYDQLITFIKAKGWDALSDDQIARFDALTFERQRAKIEEERERAAVIEQIELADVEMTIKPGTHTQKNRPIWIVSLSQHVDRDTYNQLAAAAKRLGGHWSSFDKNNTGFLFWREEDADTFANVKDGDVSAEDRREHVRRWREEQAADRLEQYAMRHDQAALEKLTRDRLTNTVRRARMAASVEADARQEQAMAATVVSVANALQNGCNGVLRGVRYASDIVTLSYLAGQAQRDYATKHSIRYWAGEPLPELSNAVVRVAKFPFPWVDRYNAEDLLAKAKGKRGQASNIAHLKALQNSDGIRCVNQATTNAMLELVKAIGFDMSCIHHYSTCKILQRMGITSSAILRHALREITPHIVAPQQADPVLKAERDLIGCRIAGYVPTPSRVVDTMIIYANVKPGDKVLEPEAGDGNIVERVIERVPDVKIVAIEIAGRLCGVLSLKNLHKWDRRVGIVHGDFLEVEPLPEYDVILMNPPFEDGQDTTHIMHAYKFIKAGGVLVAIMSPGPFFRQAKADQSFREWFEEKGGERLAELPSGTFAESGIGVSAVMVRLYK